MDNLSDILDDVYVDGTVFGHAVFHGPWSVFTNGADFSIFHAVLEGEAFIEWDGNSQHLQKGSLAIVPRGAGHVMRGASGEETNPIWIVDLFGFTLSLEFGDLVIYG